MAARNATIECVAGRNGLISLMIFGSTASGYAPFEPEICATSTSTPMALPTLPKLATIVYVKNENTKELVQPASMNSHGLTACICRNRRLPPSENVLCSSAITPNTP